MANCIITDRCVYWAPNGSIIAIENAPVYAIPDSTARRYDDGIGTYRTLGVNPEIITVGWERGRRALTDGTGTFSFSLPQSVGSTHPADPEAIWTIVLPSGDQWFGVVPAVAGPLTIDQLVETYGWTQTNTIYTQPTTQGAFTKGIVTFVNANTQTVLFLDEYDIDSYIIKLTPSINALTGNPLERAPSYTNKSTTGFDIVLGEDFTGTIDWVADAT